MLISIIIPTYNEESNIVELIRHLQKVPGKYLLEIIVADGGSADKTVEVARAEGAISFVAKIKGRAGQMNEAANIAKGTVLYFIHADTRPPADYQKDIADIIEQGYDCGSFLTRFDSSKWLLRINEWFTRFNHLFVRGGDQSIFITRELFNRIGGYKEEMLIMEDYDFLERICKSGRFKVIHKGTLISARKYDNNTWLSVQLANLKVVKMYRKGASQQEMIDTYKKMLNYRNSAF